MKIYKSIRYKKLLILLPLALIVFLSAVFSFAGEVTLTWNPPVKNTDGTVLTDLGGYIIYYGTAPRIYDHSINVGNTTSHRIRDLTERYTYYFALTAYDISNNESEYSSEVSRYITSTSSSGETNLFPPSSGTCEERCGLQSPSGCWCDDFCIEYGDCCPDYDAVCFARYFPYPGNSCDTGKIYDCDLNCLSASDADLWTGDGNCDDGTFGVALICPEFNNDAGDCDVIVDGDGDSIDNAVDNCPYVANASQTDRDGDGVGDICDNCINDDNTDQADANGNGIGDVCDSGTGFGSQCDTYVQYASLSDCNLSGRDLSGLDLRFADLSNANLSYANLTHANLERANLTSANLEGAVLENAYFGFANLSNTDLSGASLSGAYLYGATVSNADLSYANLSGTYANNSNFTGSNFFQADMTNTSLVNSLLTECNLNKATLLGADLRGNANNKSGVIWSETICPDGTISELYDGDGFTCMNNL